MLNPTQILTEAATALRSKTSSRPDPEVVVNALLETEKLSRKPSKSAHSDQNSQQDVNPDPEPNARHRTTFTDLIGRWRLCFVTGTQKIREKAGRKIGPGRYIPRWVEISVSYASPKSDEQLVDPSVTEFDPGLVENSVRVGQLRLVLTGPTKFLQHRSILAFDFTHVIVRIGPWTIYP